MVSSVCFKVVEKAKEPELESLTCSSRTEPHEEKGDSHSWISEECDDEMVASPLSKKGKQHQVRANQAVKEQNVIQVTMAA